MPENKVTNNQGLGIGGFFGLTAVSGFIIALVGYFAPLGFLQLMTAIQLLMCAWFVAGHVKDKPQTLPTVIPITILFLALLLGPMWLVYFLFR